MKTTDMGKWISGGLLLLLATMLVYMRVIDFEFINFDDYQYIVDNPNVNSGLSWNNFIWAFSSFYHANWHPLTWVSHMLDVELFGLNPGFHHLTNLVLHLCNTLLLLMLLKKMSIAFWPSIFIASLFALHPSHIESVAWVAERKDVLSTFFFFLSLILYVNYSLNKTGLNYLFVALVMVLGLLSKAMVITLPFVMLLMDCWPLRRLSNGEGPNYYTQLRPLIIEKIPLIILVLAIVIITYLAQQGDGATKALSALEWGDRLQHAFVSYAWYFGKAFLPLSLSVFYPHPGTWPVTFVMVSVTLVVTLSLLSIWWFKRFPFLFFGWFFFLGTMVPVIGLIPVGGQAIADRYTYIPYTGLFIILGLFLNELVRYKATLLKPVILLSSGILINMLFLTWTYLSYWKYDVRLFAHVLSTQDPGYSAVLERRERTASEKEVNPLLVEIYANIGISFKEIGLLDEAIIHLQEAKRINPNYFKPFYGLGHVYWQQKEFDLAYGEISHAISLYPQGRREFEKELRMIEAMKQATSKKNDNK